MVEGGSCHWEIVGWGGGRVRWIEARSSMVGDFIWKALEKAAVVSHGESFIVLVDDVVTKRLTWG